MSYDIYLQDPVSKKPIMLDEPHQMKGGIYREGGTREAWINITYNYSGWYYKTGVFPDYGEEKSGIRAIYGMSGAESIPVLTHAINKLKAMEVPDEKRSDNYWEGTRENAMRPLYQLLSLARMRPDGIWDGD